MGEPFLQMKIFFVILKKITVMAKSKIIVLLSSVLVFILFARFLTLNFETNDDPFMLLIASGALTAMPNEHIVFSNIMIGNLLKTFYQWNDQVSWYTWYLILMHFISMIAVLLAYSYKNKRDLAEFFLFILVYLLGYQTLWLVNLQFTSTAFVCGFAALIFLQSRFGFSYKIAVSGALFILSFLIRRNTIIPMMLFGVLFMVFAYLQQQPVKKYVLFLSLMVLAYFGFWNINYANEAYVKSNYYEFQEAAAVLTNNPVEITDEQLKSNKLSRNDMNLFNAWFWVDRNLFNDQKVTALCQSAHVARTGKDLLMKCLRHISDERFAILMFLISFLYVPFLKDKKLKSFIVLNALLVFAFLLYLIMTARLPKRVSTPMWGYLVLVNCIYLAQDLVRHRWRYIILGSLAVLSVYKFWCVCQLSQLNKEHAPLYISAVKQINDHPDQIFITMGKSFPIENLHVFDRSHNLIKNKNLIFTGWLINTPTYSEILKINNISNISAELIYNERMRLIVVNQHFIKVLEQYYADHYDIRIRFERDASNQGVLQVYRAVLL
jgi:hypothetical protein